MPETKILLTKKETADLLGLSVPTIDRMIARGDLPIVKLKRTVRFKVVDLANYINQSTKIQQPKKQIEANG